MALKQDAAFIIRMPQEGKLLEVSTRLKMYKIMFLKSNTTFFFHLL